jgi:hypothetical protein
MKKTNAKITVKKLQAPVQVNVHQVKMDKIAKDMAVLFEKKITASELAKWLVMANTHSDPHDDLIWHLGYDVLPGLIESKTKEDRISFLVKELPRAFDFYKFANESLFQVGSDYLTKNKGLKYFAELIEEFMSVYLALLSICEKFDLYEYEEKEMKKELNKAA